MLEFHSLRITQKCRWSRWLCKCDCGTISIYPRTFLSRGDCSCGCNQWKHGFARHHDRHPIFMAWIEMRRRCLDRKRRSWKHYGGRGISVCKRWAHFENFRDDMLPTWKQGLSLDRIDNDGNYEPKNCKWSDWFQQAHNRRSTLFMTFNGIRLPLIDWARVLDVNYHTIWLRYINGWDEDDVLFGLK